MNNIKRKVKNPLGRLCLAAVLTVWSGANIWSLVFRWRDIWSDDVNSRSIGLLFSILFFLVPLVVAIWLLWSVTVGPEGMPDRTAKQKSTKGKVKTNPPQDRTRPEAKSPRKKRR